MVTYENEPTPANDTGMRLLQKLGGVTANGLPLPGHPDDVILEPDELPDEPVESFVLRLDEREKPFYIEEDFYIRTKHGTTRVRIHSIESQIMEHVQETFRPKRPIIRGRDGQPLSDIEVQEKVPKYRQAMLRFGRHIGYLYILYGTLGLTLVNKAGEEVWNAAIAQQDPHDCSQEVYHKAFAALDGMGLSETTLTQWYQAITRISNAKEQESDADFLSGSASNSAYL